MPHTHNVLQIKYTFPGTTAIFVGCFVVAADRVPDYNNRHRHWGGLSSLGVGARRNWFYLPPIVIGTALALLAAMWPNSRIQT